jgi:SulP family sulfate permease
VNITNQIHFRNVQGDILGGLTAAVVALPMALAFGIASGAGASAGLWGAILVGLKMKTLVEIRLGLSQTKVHQ